MGFKLADLAMASNIVTGWTKAILVIVAIKADDKTGECYPSQKTIAHAVGASVATVNRALDQLEAQSLLSRTRRSSAAGYRTSDLITLDRTKITASQLGTEPTRQPANLADSNSLDITLQTPNYHGDSAEDHSVDHSVDHSDIRSTEDEFAEFYEAYPRKQGRADALKAYRAARRAAAPDQILAGARAYNLTTAGKEREFIKLPAGWLRGRRWEDTPIPQTPSKDERTRQTIALGQELSRGFGRPPRQSEMPDECPLHPGYPADPCARCERDALALPEGADF